LQGEGLRREFLGDRKGKGAADAVKKFVGMNAENALKTKPRDYAADHADIALLRLRNFTVGRKLKDEEVAGKGGLGRVVELLGCLVPFVSPRSALNPYRHHLPAPRAFGLRMTIDPRGNKASKL